MVNPLSALLASLLVALAAACSHGPRLRVTAGPALKAKLPVRLALVGPVALRWDEPSALLSFARAQDVAGALAAGGKLAVLGPGQLGAGPDGAAQELESADLSRVAMRRGLRLDELLVARAWAERRVASSAARLTDAQGKPVGAAAAAEVTLVAHVELFYPATHTLLVEVVTEGPGDPAAEHPALDAQPELGPLLAAATRRGLEELERGLQLPAPLDLGLSLVPGPGPALSFSTRGLRSLREEVRTQDELAQDLAVENALAVLAPGLGDDEARLLRRAQVSLLVREVSGRAEAAGLRPGDVITAADGRPVQQAHDLATAALLGKLPLQLSVQRAGTAVVIELR